MLDIKFIRQNPDSVKAAIRKRNYPFNLDEFLLLDEKRKLALSETESLYARQNKIAAEVKKIMASGGEAQPKITESKEIKKQAGVSEKNFQELDSEFKKKLNRIPNIPHSSLPVGDSSANRTIRTKAKPRKFKFKPVDHITLAENLGIADFPAAARIAGSNFSLFKGAGARLQRALVDFMLDIHTRKGSYIEISPPALANESSMYTTGQLPNLRSDMYELKEDGLFLIPTGEVPLTNIYRDTLFSETDLPVCYAAYTPCFRREAGSYGKDTRGLVRVHQFDKVELVKFVKPDTSYAELESLLADAVRVIELLKLPYRVVLLATGDLSFAAAKCYDIELYAPGIGRWLEVSSCSNFEDFQARRGNIRYKEKSTGKNRFVHTLNGSGVALPRLVTALLENYQEKDGSVSVPKALRKYLDGRKRIKK